MTEFVWKRYEFDFYEKNFDFEVHELIDFLHPGFRENYGKTFNKDKILSFNNFSDWKKYLEKILFDVRKKKIKLITFAELTNYPSGGDNIKYLSVYRFLKKNKMPYLQILAPGYPLILSGKKKYFRSFYFFRNLRYIILILKSLFFQKLRIFFNYKPRSILIAGKFYKDQAKKNKIFKKINLVNFNCWEYSSTINRDQDVEKNLVNGKYAVFLNMQGPMKKEDTLLFKTKMPETIGEYYPLLNRFFSNIEKIFNLKVIIASHPKSLENGKLDYLGNRQAFCNKTQALVRNCEFVISRNSTSLNYSIIYKKPMFFIYSNQSKKNYRTLYQIKSIAKMLKTDAININDEFNTEYIKSLIKFDIDAYKNYEENYLTSNSSNKNYSIIINETKNILGI